MKTLTTLTFFLFLTSLNSFTQTAEDLYNESLKEINNKNYYKGIELMDEFIDKYPDFENIHMIYLNRASAKSLNEDYEGAIQYYTTAYEKNSTSAEAIRQRGYTKKTMGDLKGALADYDLH